MDRQIGSQINKYIDRQKESNRNMDESVNYSNQEEQQNMTVKHLHSNHLSLRHRHSNNSTFPILLLSLKLPPPVTALSTCALLLVYDIFTRICIFIIWVVWYWFGVINIPMKPNMSFISPRISPLNGHYFCSFVPHMGIQSSIPGIQQGFV
jgi:hypothetical protein